MSPHVLLRPAIILVAAFAAGLPRAQAAEPAATVVTWQAVMASPDAAPPISPPTCPVLSQFTDGPPLAHVQAALQSGEHLNVLVVGSATVLGPDPNSPEASFPYRMARALKAAVPGADISLTVTGGKGLTAADMVALLRQALAKTSYQLVLWQTGSIEAMKGMKVDDLAAALAEGRSLTQSAGADLILIDPQFSRHLRDTTNLAPYEAALEHASTPPDASLFRRYELMQAWADNGGIDLEHAAPADRQKVADMLHACLGRALARRLLTAAGPQAALK